MDKAKAYLLLKLLADEIAFDFELKNYKIEKVDNDKFYICWSWGTGDWFWGSTLHEPCWILLSGYNFAYKHSKYANIWGVEINLPNMVQ